MDYHLTENCPPPFPGEVIGILSRADPTESQRCYISPTYEWKGLVKIAKNAL